jgi:hypothetical protein
MQFVAGAIVAVRLSVVECDVYEIKTRLQKLLDSDPGGSSHKGLDKHATATRYSRIDYV